LGYNAGQLINSTSYSNYYIISINILSLQTHITTINTSKPSGKKTDNTELKKI
jgi:hypothetical protein